MSFYGAIVKPGKSVPYVPPPEEWGLHLSQAALPATTKEGKRVSLMVKDQSGSEYIMCTLKAGSQDSVPLDLFFHTYAEFRVVGDAEVHITGYFSPSEIEGDDEDGPPGMMDGYDVSTHTGSWHASRSFRCSTHSATGSAPSKAPLYIAAEDVGDVIKVSLAYHTLP